VSSVLSPQNFEGDLEVKNVVKSNVPTSDTPFITRIATPDKLASGVLNRNARTDGQTNGNICGNDTAHNSEPCACLSLESFINKNIRLLLMCQ
jgi:hypothetical protein